MSDREVAPPPPIPGREPTDVLTSESVSPRRVVGLQAEANATPPGSVEPPVAPPSEPAAPKEHKETKETAKETKESKEKEAPPAEEPAPLPISIARLVPKLKKSAKLFEEGKKHIPNSTSSLIRVASYDPCPPFITRGKGPRIWDEDENEYLDFNLAYGCLINGHAHPQMVKAIQKQAELGFHFASPTES